MSRLYKFTSSVIIVALCCCLQHQQQCAAQPQSSTVRPYKFGFTIDQQQHRQETRDERGIVMGEFGFITADGIYHVTVYATDEQGRFRILAMKSYPYESPPKTVEIMLRPKAVQTTTTTTTTTPKAELARHDFYNEACSGCFLSKGKNKTKGQGETPKTEIRTLSKSLPNAPFPSPSKTNVQTTKLKPAAGKPATGSNKGPIFGSTGTHFKTKQDTKHTHSNPNTAATTLHNVTARPNSKFNQTPQFGKDTTRKNTKQQGLQPKTATVTKTGTGQQDMMDIIVNQVLPTVMGSKGVVTNTPTANGFPAAAPSGKAPSKSFNPSGTGKTSGSAGKAPSKPFNPTGTGKTSGNSGSKANTNSNAGGDGDLYRFKYTLDYHGHSETGKRNGNKVGNFYAIGDDNIERTIDYVANENGYQPRIHWRKLDQAKASSLPKVNTLKDYEFVWFTQN